METVPGKDHSRDLNEVLLSWKSASHPFKKRDRIFYQTVAAITILLVVIVFFLHEIMLIGVILSVAFVVYAISTIPPSEVEHVITPIGFTNAGRVFRWEELNAFWFEEKWGFTMVTIQTKLSFPGLVQAVIPQDKKEKIREVVGRYLLFYQKPPKTFTDSFSSWLGKKIPLDTLS